MSKPSHVLKTLLPAALIFASTAPLWAQDIKVALVTSKTGAFELYAKQAEAGLKLGFEYATQGSMKINGRPLVIIYKDDQLKPDRARAVM